MRGTDCKFLDHGTTGRLTFPLLTILLHQYDLEIILASLVLGPKLPDAIGTSSQNLKHSLSGNTASLSSHKPQSTYLSSSGISLPALGCPWPILSLGTRIQKGQWLQLRVCMCVWGYSGSWSP